MKARWAIYTALQLLPTVERNWRHALDLNSRRTLCGFTQEDRRLWVTHAHFWRLLQSSLSPGADCPDCVRALRSGNIPIKPERML